MGTFIYHFGSDAVCMSWHDDSGRTHVGVMRPGDSAYVAPMVKHWFSVHVDLQLATDGSTNPNGSACGRGRRLFVVRIPGHLTSETLSEFATFSAHGRERVGAETLSWYN